MVVKETIPTQINKYNYIINNIKLISKIINDMSKTLKEPLSEINNA
jgi:hypothetical protein